jgi:aminoglycoside 3-N-acetyltransferase
MILARDISAAVSDLSVAEDDVLFVHSGLRDSLRVAGGTAREKMATVLDGLRGAVPSGTLMMPTFTYSFCREEPFDVQASPSTVGVLTEWFRRQPGVRRTPEPIFSVAVQGPIRPEWEPRLFAVGDKECFGAESIFAYLLEVDAKILLYGADFDTCTLVHYVEQAQQVPYRFMKPFSGTVRHDGIESRVTARYFVRELRSGTEVHLGPLASRLTDEGVAARTVLRDGPTLVAVSARALEAVATRALTADPRFVIREGHEAAVELS